MVIVSGQPLDISTLDQEYPEKSFEKLLLSELSESTEKYLYSSLDQLKFELQLRKEIVNAAKALSNSKFSFAVFHKSECNPEFWERTFNGGFKLKKDVKPSDAINDIFTNGDQYATECATAMIIVYYKALLTIFQEELFNKEFSDIYLMNWHSIDPLLRDVGIPKKVTDILPGDRGYFSNPDVNPKTPEWQGENVIVLPDDRYYGHGIGITTADKIINALNDNRKKDATESAQFLDTVSRPNFKKIFDVYHSASAQTAFLDWEGYPQVI